MTLALAPNTEIEGDEVEHLPLFRVPAEVGTINVRPRKQLSVVAVVVAQRGNDFSQPLFVLRKEVKRRDAQIDVAGRTDVAALSSLPLAIAGAQNVDPPFPVAIAVSQKGRNDGVSAVCSGPRCVERKQPIVRFRLGASVDEAADHRGARSLSLVAKIPEKGEDDVVLVEGRASVVIKSRKKRRPVESPPRLWCWVELLGAPVQGLLGGTQTVELA